MKRIINVCLFCILALSAAAQSGDIVITASSFDKVTKSTTFNDLKKIYGAKNVRDEIDYGAEGADSFMVTKVFKGKKNEFVVMWAEKKFHKQVSCIDAYQKNSPYVTADGLRVGSTLDALVKVNGKKISFSGFFWDYGGNISEFHNGKLEKSKIYFALNAADGIPDKLIGEVVLNTDMALVKKNLKKIFVSKVSVCF